MAITSSNSCSTPDEWRRAATTTRAWSRTTTIARWSVRLRSPLSCILCLGWQLTTSITTSLNNSSTGSSRCCPKMVEIMAIRCRKFAPLLTCSCQVSCLDSRMWITRIRWIRLILCLNRTLCSSSRRLQLLWRLCRLIKTIRLSNISNYKVWTAMDHQHRWQATRTTSSNNNSSSSSIARASHRFWNLQRGPTTHLFNSMLLCWPVRTWKHLFSPRVAQPLPQPCLTST